MLLTLTCGLAVLGCPLFAEFLPDPQEVTDNLGEFVEIRLGTSFSTQDTLFIQFENKEELAFTAIAAPRLLLHRDTSQCISSEWLDCRPLVFPALPNSKASFWNLRSPNCVDSAEIPVPKAGRSFQRYGAEKDNWVLTTPTPGEANSEYESGIKDCAISIKQAVYQEKRWRVQFLLSKCDSSLLKVSFLPLLYRSILDVKELFIRDSLWVSQNNESSSLWLKAELPPDESPRNNRIDTLLFLLETAPLYLTEVHHCPEEPVPEWVEVYSRVSRALPLSGLGFGKRGLVPALPSDSIYPYESIVFTKDTAAFLQAVQIPGISVRRAPLGYLKNVEDSLFLTYKEAVLDFTFWNKEKGINCPNGFNPSTGRIENTPGFQGKKNLSNNEVVSAPFTFKINTRVVSKSLDENSLRVLIQSEGEVLIELLSGKGALLWQKRNEPFSNAWIHIPLKNKGFLGPNFIRFSAGHYEKMVGVVLRP